jgi:hypothetical protein
MSKGSKAHVSPCNFGAHLVLGIPILISKFLPTYIIIYIYIEREHHFPYAISQDISLCKISEYLKYLDKQTISLVLSRIFIETCK